jgi:preprotein translocase subunit SecB
MIKAEQNKAFTFSKFRVSKFSYEETGKYNDDLEIEFEPKGKYNTQAGLYELYLTFSAIDKESGKSVMNIESIAEFLFDKPYTFEELPPYFFANSIPILFPYLRAFVSAFTLQANANVVMLGLIKFSNVAEPLKDNTEII